MTTPKVFRLIIPVDSIDEAVAFYRAFLGQDGERVWSNRHYFHCGDVMITCLEPGSEYGNFRSPTDPRIIYFAVDNLESMQGKLQEAGTGRLCSVIETQPWGERSFYAEDPFGNQLCFVHESTVYTGGKHEK